MDLLSNRTKSVHKTVFDALFASLIALTLVGCEGSNDSAPSRANAIPQSSQAESGRKIEKDFEPPNIIFVMADDLGISGIGCYENRVIETPNLDKMAQEGMLFRNAYSGSPVCAPSRCILMTGKHAGHCSIRANTGGVPLPESELTIAELLKSAGYVTGGFGKWALGIEGSEGDPLRQGFDEFFGYYHQTHAHDHFPEYLVRNGEREKLPGNIGARMTKKPEGFVGLKNPVTDEQMQFAPDLILEEAKGFIRRNADERFFCYLPITLPHGSFHFPSDHPISNRFQNKSWSTRAKIVGAMTELMDQQMGDLFALLGELNIDHKTIVFFCSDHGAALRFEGEIDASGPYKGKKRTMFEGGLRIPMIVRWPGMVPSQEETELPIYLGDIFATCGELSDSNQSANNSDELDSISFLPELLQQGQQMKHELFVWEWAVYNPRVDQWLPRMQALRQGNWKILRNSENDPWQFYNVVNDPFENNDLANSLPVHTGELFEIFKFQVEPRPPQPEALDEWMGEFPFQSPD